MRRLSLCSSPDFSVKHRELLVQWRGSESIAAVFSFLGLVTATVDYEVTYQESRTKETCEVRSDDTDMCKWLCLFFTLVSVLFTIARYRLQRFWLTYQADLHQPSSFLPSIRYRLIHRPPLYRTLTMMSAEIVVLAIFPYPIIIDEEIRFHERILNSTDYDNHFAPTITCYRLSELCYSLMILRLFLILRAVFNRSQFADQTAAMLCLKYRAKFGLRFVLKATARHYPRLFFIVSLVLACLIFSVTMRVFERPYSYLSDIDMSPMINSLWFCLTSLDSAPYGDYYAQTMLGRITSFLQCCTAIALVAVAKVFMLDYIDLRPGERRAYESIHARKLAAKAIAASYSYYRTRKTFSVRHKNSVVARSIASSTVKEFSDTLPKLKERVGLSESDFNKDEKVKKLEEIESLICRIDSKLTARQARLGMRLQQACKLALALQDCGNTVPLD